MVRLLHNICEGKDKIVFIYIGNDDVVMSNKIISILEYQLIHSSPKLRQLIEKQKKANRIFGSYKFAKSIVITDDGIYYSPLSAQTLKKRDALYPTMNQVEKF